MVVCNTEDDGGFVSWVGVWNHSYPEGLHSGGDSHQEMHIHSHCSVMPRVHHGESDADDSKS
ncbi:hypothetical protein E2C01_032481 [Portunus trituberculatus]|uniref:Uncharacterized protein n=1 Tax=Portunus trituberculatus TaxID=210409 RepID=A0A5B7EXM1_PORTR|nr:hypothetical protein [Portunus trituberculatus]